MISKLPWQLDEDGDKIYDADGDVIAEDYRFIHVDDFEAICRLINDRMPIKKEYMKALRAIKEADYEDCSILEVMEDMIEDYLVREKGRLGKIVDGKYIIDGEYIEL